jgi:predicted PurR-regulated permease PerM
MKPNIQSRIFFYILFAFSAYLAYLLIGPYVGTVVFAVVTVTVFQPVHELFVRLFRGRHGPATALTIVTIFVAVLVPVGAILSVAVQQALQFSRDLSQLVRGAEQYPTLAELLGQINRLLAGIPFAQDFQLTPAGVFQTIESTARAMTTFLAESAISLSSASVDLIISVVIYVSLLGALFSNYPRLIQTLRKMSPLSDEMDEKYIRRVTVITKSMVRGVFVLALAQGLTMGGFFLIGEVKYASFWTIAATFMAMTPLGAGVIGVPIGIIHIILGNVWQGIVIVLGYAIVVSTIQYYLTPRLVAREARLNTALVLLSVFGGLKMFGVMGLVYGPVIMIFVVTTIEIYMDYYRIAKSATVLETLVPDEVASPSLSDAPEPDEELVALADWRADDRAWLDVDVRETTPEAAVGMTPATDQVRPWSIWSTVRRLPRVSGLRFSVPWVRGRDGS